MLESSSMFPFIKVVSDAHVIFLCGMDIMNVILGFGGLAGV
jgi:hypothetical protein